MASLAQQIFMCTRTWHETVTSSAQYTKLNVYDQNTFLLLRQGRTLDQASVEAVVIPLPLPSGVGIAECPSSNYSNISLYKCFYGTKAYNSTLSSATFACRITCSLVALAHRLSLSSNSRRFQEMISHNGCFPCEERHLN